MAKAEKLRHDPDFLSQRQRHVDLNAKLRVLKARFSEWENATGAEQQPRKVIKQEKGLSVPNRPVPTYDSNFDL
jgi:hypothetical protein